MDDDETRPVDLREEGGGWTYRGEEMEMDVPSVCMCDCLLCREDRY